MPEGDTVYRTAEALRRALAGKTLTRCDIRVPRFATVDLTGQTVDEILSRGKHLFIRVGSVSIHSHLMMNGSWQTGRLRSAAYQVRIILETADAHAYGVDLGLLEVLARGRDQDAVADLGPDVLGPDWSVETAAANLIADPMRPLAETLLDQRVLAGLGNVYANELCFLTGLRPDTVVAGVPDPHRLVSRAQQLVWANRSRAQRITTGDARRGHELWVYGRAGRPCRRCRTPVFLDAAGPRVRFWCPSCQR